MPIYRYVCDCGHAVDDFRKIDDRDDAPDHCGKQMVRKIMPTSVQADINPYRSVAVDKETGKPVVINSRKQHREFLKKNDYIEVGNEAPKFKHRAEQDSAPMLTEKQLRQAGLG